MVNSFLRTLVLDDDPTGTQSASDVNVLFSPDATALIDALRDDQSAYVLTNTRAVDESSAVFQLEQIRDDAVTAATVLGAPVRIVLRGDSTLRGHVFPETEVFASADDLLVFVPAFPAAGRTTTGGIHRIDVDGDITPAHLTEFATDPVFGYSTSDLAEYTRQRTSRPPLNFTLEQVRRADFGHHLGSVESGTVVIPDAEFEHDIGHIAAAIEEAEAMGRRIVVRSGAPLAAALAGVTSVGLLARPLQPTPSKILVVCGSHTGAASNQLARFEEVFGPAVIISTASALRAPLGEGRRAADEAIARLTANRVVAVSTERVRSDDHATLDHAEQVMVALMESVRLLAPHIDAVISKGGITGARTAVDGLAAASARVIGQVAMGVSLWELHGGPYSMMRQIVVPGNVGQTDTLLDAISALGVRAPAAREPQPVIP